MNKQFFAIVALLFFIGGTTSIASGRVFAQESTPQHPMTLLIQKIADKFRLNKNDVQAVFDEHHKEMRAVMFARWEEKLSQLVNEGKITQAQKTLILNKMKELAEKREANKTAWQNKTREEIREQMRKEREELEQWAKNNGIDPQYLIGFGRGFYKGWK
ncbi:MAG: hypothetical protein N3A54_03625 [Patescibacteria group bacterium]|nr:hypothetical protein [Patescibacteria group bacterium]